MARALRVCPRCGAGNDRTSWTCTRCGLVLRESAGPRRPSLTTSEGLRKSLYDRRESRPQLNLKDLVRVIYAPEKALSSLYLSANLTTGMLILTLTGILVWTVSAVAIEGTTAFRIGHAVGGFVGYGAYFVGLTTLATALSKWPFKGRGDLRSTFVLLACCTPWLAVLSTAMTTVFYGGGAVLGNDSPVMFTILVPLVILGCFWTLAIFSFAISIADNVDTGPAAFATLVGVTGASFLLDAASVALHLVGVGIAASVIPINFLG